MIKKETIKTIIREFHNSDIPNFIRREKDTLIDSGKVISIIGPRRSGKTYFLYQIIQDLLNKGVTKDRVVYINFEDERFTLRTDELDLILQAYKELYPDNKIVDTYFLFDEIQNINGWETFLRRIYDGITKNIFITGSNSKLLGEEISTSLRGRTLAEEMLPLSFREFLKFKGFNYKIPQDFYDTTIKAKLLEFFREYMLWGGFPEILFYGETLKLRILQEYFNVMIYRDLIERYSIKDTFVLKYFIKRLAENVTKPVSINKIYNELRSQGIKLNKNLLYDFLDYLENAYIIRRLTKRKRSILNTELAEKKVYFIDNGILKGISVFDREDYGILFENLVFREIYRRGERLYFYKERNECDFLTDTQAIQVCFSLKDEDTRRREIQGLIECIKQLDIKKGLIITFDQEEQLKCNGYEIKMIPAYKWLL